MAAIPLALYMWRRIHSVGCETILGVPGDYTLALLDYIKEVQGLKFVGNSNELNAAYAADGYSRVKRAPGCIVTTHGVGELSALNGIANAASEFSPVIHVVGQIPRMFQEKRMMVHHSVGLQPDHRTFNECSKPLRICAADLGKVSPAKMAESVDHAIRNCLIYKQPAYIFLPLDMIHLPVLVASMRRPLGFELPIQRPAEDTVVADIKKAFYSARKPTIMVDYLSVTHAPHETRTLIDKLDLPFFASHGAKGCIDETHPKFVGLYYAWASVPGIAVAIESCDFVLVLGAFGSDLNTAFFASKLQEACRIDLLDDHALVRGQRHDGVYLAPLLTRLAWELDVARIVKPPKPTNIHLPAPPDQHSPKITHSQIWSRFSKIIKPGDVVHAETGTAALGCIDMNLPADVQYISSSYYCSIGFSTPAALGTDLALRDLHASGARATRGRTILVTGDGSLMLTMQEVATMVANKLPVLIVIVNNAGYTIERAVHGAHEAYNDIPHFEYSALLPLFGSSDTQSRFRKVELMSEVEEVLQDKVFLNPVDGPHVLELVMDKMDLPWKLAAVLHRRSAPGHLKQSGFVNADWPLVVQADK